MYELDRELSLKLEENKRIKEKLV